MTEGAILENKSREVQGKGCALPMIREVVPCGTSKEGSARCLSLDQVSVREFKHQIDSWTQKGSSVL